MEVTQDRFSVISALKTEMGNNLTDIDGAFSSLTITFAYNHIVGHMTQTLTF